MSSDSEVEFNGCLVDMACVLTAKVFVMIVDNKTNHSTIIQTINTSVD